MQFQIHLNKIDNGWNWSAWQGGLEPVNGTFKAGSTNTFGFACTRAIDSIRRLMDDNQSEAKK
jgi:hypothetical protein